MTDRSYRCFRRSLARCALLVTFLIAAPAIPAFGNGTGGPGGSLGPGRCGQSFALYADILRVNFAEIPQVRAVDREGGLVVVFVNPDTTTWTMLHQSPGGRTCYVTSGDGWELFTPVPSTRAPRAHDKGT